MFQTMSYHSLVEIAIQWLKLHPNESESPHTIGNTYTKLCDYKSYFLFDVSKAAVGDSVESLSLAMAGIHQSACQYASVLLGVQAFSPRTFVEFISHFDCLYDKLLKQWRSKSHR